MKEFATLLKITMPAPSNQDCTMQQMQPLEWLEAASNHTAWKSKYILSRDPSAPMCDFDSDEDCITDTWIQDDFIIVQLNTCDQVAL